MEKTKNFKAFTLAEVLITLTIIGVIAALTIPNLMQKWQDHADVAKVKEAYSILSNALKLAIRDNGEIDDWNWPQKSKGYPTENGQYAITILSPYLKITNNCFNDNTIGNCSKYQINFLQGTPGVGGSYYYNYYLDSLVLQNGMTLSTDLLYLNPATNLSLKIDINGAKKPNRIGYDIFYFSFKSNGTLYNSYTSKHCNTMISSSEAGSDNGHACANWIIKHGNMDYKYRDVSKEW